jgi:hypothetical protein
MTEESEMNGSKHSPNLICYQFPHEWNFLCYCLLILVEMAVEIQREII